ncbi:hypothetical protein [Halobacteriovorax sp.]|uniref:hypothetical protein n=1 Tax=Halobacteriovorax sp. TaxID=2020862 RepID=UPI0035689034
MLQKIITLSILIYSTTVLSATFIPLSLEKQMENADGVLRGKFKGVEYRKISDNKIITEATFSIVESVGVKQSEIINKNNFKVIYPGGKWQNLDYRVSGTPSFKDDEEAILILKKTSLGYTVKGLGMGKYEVVKNEDNEFYKSSVFPNHVSLGEISKNSFETVILNEFGTDMKSVKSDKFVNVPVRYIEKKSSTSGRFPASVGRSPGSENLDQSEEDNSGNPIWIAIIFGLLGAASVYSIRRSKRMK